jgi:hypothetical protein
VPFLYDPRDRTRIWHRSIHDDRVHELSWRDAHLLDAPLTDVVVDAARKLIKARGGNGVVSRRNVTREIIAAITELTTAPTDEEWRGKLIRAGMRHDQALIDHAEARPPAPSSTPSPRPVSRWLSRLQPRAHPPTHPSPMRPSRSTSTRPSPTTTQRPLMDARLWHQQATTPPAAPHPDPGRAFDAMTEAAQDAYWDAPDLRAWRARPALGARPTRRRPADPARGPQPAPPARREGDRFGQRTVRRRQVHVRQGLGPGGIPRPARTRRAPTRDPPGTPSRG